MPRIPGMQDFLQCYPGMAIVPMPDRSSLMLSGTFTFTANSPGGGEVKDCYNLQIIAHSTFPKRIPEVKEIGERIPPSGEFHINQNGTICLGTPLRLILTLSKEPTLPGFANQCLIPYLYAVSRRLHYGVPLIFNELQHGNQGKLVDYSEIFGLKEPEKARDIVKLICMKDNIADKQPCPCGCGRLLGDCSFKQKIKAVSKLVDKPWLSSFM
jgi:hypothetical protein